MAEEQLAVEGDSVVPVREKLPDIELVFDADMLSWKGYKTLMAFAESSTSMTDLMEALQECYVGEVPIERMPYRQITAAGLALLRALNAQVNPGEEEGN